VSKSLERAHFAERPNKEPEEARLLAKLLARRYSCRGFKPTPVPRDVIESFLSIAQLSASWCNSQAWEVIVTEGEGTKRFSKALYDYAVNTPPSDHAPTDFPMPAKYVGRYQERRRECGWQLYEAVGIAQGDRAASGKQVLENFKLFGAPHAMVITSNRDLGVYGAVDCGGYVANVMTAAQAYGVDTIAQAAIAMQAEVVRKFFNLPDDRMIVCGMSFGYGDTNHPANKFRTRRDGVDEIVKWVSE